MKKQIDLMYVFGGGRNKDGSLTELSKQRLDAVGMYTIVMEKCKVLVLGGKLSTFRTNAIEFKETGADQKYNYLIKNWEIDRERVYKYPFGGDTILESFALFMAVQNIIPANVASGIKTIAIVTSSEHLRRAILCTQEAARRIHPAKEYKILGVGVPSNGLLIKKQEDDLFNLARKFWIELGKKDLPNTKNWYGWYKKHKDFYNAQEKIIQKYRPLGTEPLQAYAGVK